MLLAECNQALIADHVAWLLEMGLKPATINSGHLGVIRAILRHAHERGLIERPPTIRKLPTDQNAPDAWSADQVSAFIDACPAASPRPIAGIPAGDWWGCATRIIWYSGIRRRALLAIRRTPPEVDLETGWLRVPGSSMKNRKGKAFRLGDDGLESVGQSGNRRASCCCRSPMKRESSTTSSTASARRPACRRARRTRAVCICSSELCHGDRGQAGAGGCPGRDGPRRARDHPPLRRPKQNTRRRPDGRAGPAAATWAENPRRGRGVTDHRGRPVKEATGGDPRGEANSASIDPRRRRRGSRIDFMFYHDFCSPSPKSLIELRDAVLRLDDAIDHFDELLGGQPFSVIQNLPAAKALGKLCDALTTLWNLDDAEDPEILEYCECSGYGEPDDVVMIADQLTNMRDGVLDIAGALESTQLGRNSPTCMSGGCDPGSSGLWDDPESSVREYEVAAWWAPEDHLDDLVTRHRAEIPNDSNLWRAVRNRMVLWKDPGARRFLRTYSPAATPFLTTPTICWKQRPRPSSGRRDGACRARRGRVYFRTGRSGRRVLPVRLDNCRFRAG